MAEFNIALIPGDGIGPEIVSGAVTVLDAVSKKYGHKFNYQEVYMGGCAIDKYGVPLPQETVDICKKSDSVLLGAVGGPKWDSQPSENRPEKGLLGIRKALELYSNLRPSILKPQLKDASPLKEIRPYTITSFMTSAESVDIRAYAGIKRKHISANNTHRTSVSGVPIPPYSFAFFSSCTPR